ncbi:ATP-binding protein [Planotetraspora silvatica]|uniref:ATP-binding protein n=1 Tax=Planotetraspora silvatica TaxID=234614 RepID=UPI00195183CB|nr:ATP-binding protein [Planotetraspora silvatica]
MTDGWDSDGTGELDLTPSPRLLEVLGDIPYQPWQCLAELVDNSFDEFRSDLDRDPADPPAIHITLPRANTALVDAQVVVSDNGRGMSLQTLRDALRAGFSGNARYGSLGLFGMGFNIATARLGSKTTVRTSRAGDPVWLVAEIDFKDLQRRETFHVPLRRERKEDPLLHGTAITIRDLRPNMVDALKRPKTISTVKDKLGRVYSYLLRDHSPIPELPDDDTLAGSGIGLYINGKRVKPRIPCVWAASRSVTYSGAEIKAVQVIDRKLQDAYACMRCGHWHRHYDVVNCVECGSDDLELRQRRIHGWLGVQRYLDESDYGIDFLRHGRKILLGDKSLFTWVNPDTGETLDEYPIEIPANQGRLVGEIHIDHAPVNYQKTDFDRSSRDWNDAALYLRGEGPMRKTKAKDRGFAENDSPLGILFKAFQQNDPGIRCLIPGNGQSATHKLTSDWGSKFHEGLAEYQLDEKWYEAVLNHEEIKNRATTQGGSDVSPAGGDLGSRTGLDPLPLNTPNPGLSQPPVVLVEPEPPVETEEQRYARYRQHARKLYDLEGEVSALNLGKRNVSVFETTIPVADASGAYMPTISRVTSGLNLEVYVHGDHEVFREFGRDPRDYAILEISQVLRALARDVDTKITVIAAEVTCQFPDQRRTDSALRDRAAEVLRRVRDLATPVITAQAPQMWTLLSSDSKLRAERDAARVDPRLDWLGAIHDGRFSAYLSYDALAGLVRGAPAAFMDGAVYSMAWASWTDEQARDRQVSHVARLLETVGEFVADASHKSRQELVMTRLAIDMLDDIVARRE